MAESSVHSTVQWLGELLVEEEEYLRAIRQKVEQLRDELDWMQCFLREADLSRSVDPRINRWVIQIQEIAYEAEDIVESFLVKFHSHQNQHHSGTASSLKNAFERYLWIVKEAKAIHDGNNDIEALRIKVETLTSRLQAYGLKITRPEACSSTLIQHGLNVFKEERFIKLDDKVKQIAGELVAKTSSMSKVIGLWGKNGVGKTTLARKVYNHYVVRKHFDRFVWVNVSIDMNIKSLLRRLLSSVAARSLDEIDIMTEQVMVQELYEVFLAKKCLVILDDIMSKDLWDGLTPALPEVGDKNSGSKILFTVQSKQVAEQFYPGTLVHEVRCLSYDESWELMESKLGGFPMQIFGMDGANKMIEMGKKMLRSCQGVPLATTALGGLLATTKSPEQWQTLLDKLNSQHNAVHLEQPCGRVIEMCYYGLPYYLKNCFLYLGIFPENFDIPVKKLCQMWVADRIVLMANGNASKDGSLEDFAEHCLSELLQRGLVQVAKRGSTGKIRSCSLHRIMRDFCLKVSKEENFLTTIQNNADIISGKSRRLALHFGEEEQGNLSLLQKNQFLRCLLLFPSQKENSEVNYMSIKTLCNDSPLLRILDLEGIVNSSKTLPREIGELIYLRYLSLKDMPLTKLPPTIGNLKWLETLDLRAKVRLELPNVLYRLERLKHLYLPCYFTVKDSEKLRLENLENLLTLKNVNHFMTVDVLGMKFLRKASVRFMSDNEHIEFIKKSTTVVFSLTVFQAVISEEQVNVLQNFHNLIKLELKGGLSVPINKLKFPPILKKLVLDFCGLLHDPMPELEKLPSLASLCLDHQAYMGKKMICSAAGFPQLTYLRVQGLKILEEWKVEKGAMPNLLKLEIKGCERLVKIPDGFSQQSLITHD